MSAPAPSATSLKPGARLGPYEIASRLGAGGMGEVYRARDTRLGRDVAVKVIAFDVSSDPDRLRRFEQEARAVATLNHPSILSIHDVGTEAGAPYVVFELLEGESLRERMAREAVPPRKALHWAAQIARGLAAAHDRGIVHRDLKPENLFVTRDGRVKILDFGLAKLLLGEETVGEAERSATLSAGTTPGTLLGTAGYMSPEQVRGQAVDGRSDIFSLGAVLYEVLSGRRAFRGNTAADTLTAILKEDPPEIGPGPSQVPPALERIVRRCLEKAPEERFQSARDLAFDLESFPASSETGATPRPGKARLGQVLAAAAILGAVALAAFFAGRRADFGAGGVVRPATLEPVRFHVTLPPGLRGVSRVILSPDGTRLAFVGAGADGRTQVWTSALSSLQAQPLAGTENVQGTPFWSPDSRSIAFISAEKLQRIDVSGGPAQTLCDAASALQTMVGGAWSQEGVILFTPGKGHGLYRVSATGGSPAPVTRLEPSRREGIHYLPAFLPDGRHFLYFIWSEDPQHRGLYSGSLDSAEAVPVLFGQAAASYAWPGYLLLQRGRTVRAQAFDARRRKPLGEPSVVAEGVDAMGFSTSRTGAMAFVSSRNRPTQPTWFDRTGRRLETVGEPGEYQQIALSPDGRRAAVQQRDPRLETTDIWLLDLARGVLSRFTSDPGTETDPVWSPDGRRLAFSAEGATEGRLTVFVKELGGTRAERVLPESWRAFVEDWSRDGRFLLYGAGVAGTEGLWAVPLTGDDKKSFPLVEGSYSNDEPQLSPDGRILAYVSNESGRPEVYVQDFPGPGPKTRLSIDGGAQPRWRRDGGELYYLAPDGAMMGVTFRPGARPEPGVPRKLFSTPLTIAIFPGWDQYAVTPDGQRFLLLAPVGDAAPFSITVVLNWTAGLDK